MKQLQILPGFTTMKKVAFIMVERSYCQIIPDNKCEDKTQQLYR
jgi:hypothetical protein